MLLDKDAILRYGGCFAIALAYVGRAQGGPVYALVCCGTKSVENNVFFVFLEDLGGGFSYCKLNTMRIGGIR